jgi:hypothetical protein
MRNGPKNFLKKYKMGKNDTLDKGFWMIIINDGKFG